MSTYPKIGYSFLLLFVLITTPFITLAQPANDNCSGASSISSSTSCSYASYNIRNATNASPIGACGGATASTTYDMWFTFQAQSTTTTIEFDASGYGSAVSSSTMFSEILSGSGCGSFTSLSCGDASVARTVTGLTVGVTYYLRIYTVTSPTGTNPTNKWNYSFCLTHPLPPPSNDECSTATTLTAATSCTNTSGYITSSTNSGVAATCGGTADDDVWYRFTAISGPLTTVTLSSLGSSLTGNTTIEILSGTCGSLTSIACATGISVSAALTAGTMYYVRVYSTGASAITSNGGFNICVTTPAPATPANVSTGKSFINITRPGGGTVVPGDVLEIRVSVNVSSAGSNRIFRSRFNDTIPANLTYVPGSLKLLTNEGKQYAAYSDAAGDDAAMYNSADKTIRFNLGRDTVNMSRGFVSNTGTDSSSGGYTDPGTHAPRGNGMLVIVTYRVTVDVATSYNTIISYGPGAVRYRNQLSSVGAVNYTLAPNMLSFIIYPNYGLCSNATGANNVSAGNGDFGSGTSHNAPNPGTVPGYTYLAITTGAPNDGSYSVVKNLSPSQSTNLYTVRPQSPSVDRVFGVWDIIGDHTGAADPVAGNPAPASGVSAGYMLAVNAAYQLSIANNQTITGLCENTYYEFSSWFRNVCKRCGSDSLGRGASGVTVNASYIPTASGDSSGVKPNLTFMIDGIDYYTSGDMDYIGNYGEWVKKGFVFLTAPGQTSLTISIKNNAPGGGGNDWVMDDISFATCLPSLTMRPTNSPTYCNNNQVDISVAVSTFFNNYDYYQWERSTDGGTTWVAAPEMPGQQNFNFTNYSGEYRDTAALPSFVAGTGYDGYKYRIRVGTTTTNLTSGVCALYNDVDIITINVEPTCAVLPVEILQFNVQLKDDLSHLTWKAKQEMNLTDYIVERSNDGVHFIAIGKVDAKGAGILDVQYMFTDMTPVYGKVYYRLRMAATEGGTKFSNVLFIQPGQQKLFEVSNIVNPISSKLSFQVATYQNEQIDIQLMDGTGRSILNSKLKITQGSNAIMLDLPSQLQAGSYFLRIVSKSAVINKVIQKN